MEPPMLGEKKVTSGILVWTYGRGQWTEINDPLDETGEDNIVTAMDLAGYEFWGSLGSVQRIGEFEPERCGPHIQVWVAKWGQEETSITKRYPYLAWFTLNGNNGKQVYFPDLPSLLMFSKEFGPLVQGEARRDFEEVAEEAVRKSFYLHHGHGVFENCVHCNPTAIAKKEKRWQRQKSSA